MINDIGIVELSNEEKKKKGTERKHEIGFVTYGQLASGLKKTTYECITNNDEVYAYEQKGEYMLKELYNFYSAHPDYLPPEYRADNIMQQYETVYSEEKSDTGLKEALQKRLVFDYIAGMMDEYVRTAYNRIRKIGEYL